MDDLGSKTGNNLPKDIVSRLRWSSKELRPFPLDAIEDAATEIERLRAVIASRISAGHNSFCISWDNPEDCDCGHDQLEQALKGEK